MIIELLRNQRQLSGLESDWNELLADSAADTIFLTWQWIASWIEVQDEVPDIFVVIARDEGGGVISANFDDIKEMTRSLNYEGPGEIWANTAGDKIVSWVRRAHAVSQKKRRAALASSE